MKNSLLFSVLLLCCITGYANGDKKKKPELTKENLLKDIDFYKRGIYNNHIDPFTNISKKQFFDALEKIKQDTANKNADEILVALLKVNAEIQDEHTNISYQEKKIFPCWFYWFKEGMTIIRTDVNYYNLLYSRVISINHIPISVVTEKLSGLSSDKNKGSIMSRVPGFLSSPTLLHGLDIIDNKDSLLLTLVNQANDTTTISVSAMEMADIHATKYHTANIIPLRYREKANYWYQYESEGNYLYLNYSRCFNDPRHPIEQFQKEFFEVVKSKSPDKIIIDVRENSGGHEGVLMPLITELSQSEIFKSYNTYKVYVLIGRKTFSAAILNVFDLMAQMHITRLGEATSGSMNHFGAIKFFDLPHSGLTVSYSTQKFVNVKNKDGALMPDVSIPETFSDYYNGTDSVLKYAIEH